METHSEQQEIKEILSSREDGFGQRLKTARNENNMTTAEVARELRLDEKIILALENEDHARLPASAFVCGYIRNYAKFLRIQPEPLIDCYKKEISQDSLDPELKITKGKQVARSFDVGKLIAPVLSLLVIAVLLLGGWKVWDFFANNNIVSESTTLLPGISQDSSNTLNSIAKDDPGSLSLPAINDVSDSMPATTAPDAGFKAPEPDTAADNTGLAMPLPAVEAISRNAQDARVTGESLRTESSSLAQGSVTTEDLAATEAIIQQAEEQQPVAVIPSPDSDNNTGEASGDNRLVLEFTGNSWIVIKDSEDKKLASGLKKAGQTLRLEGKPPYNVFLGDGRVVTISIRGNIYDHSSYINSRNIARFKVE